MGIQDLTKTIKKHAPDAIRNVTIAELPGEIYGVDVLSYLYPAKYNSAAKGKGSHIRFFFDMIVSWMAAGKKLVMVFDGNTSEVAAKSETLKKRHDVRQQHLDTIIEVTAKTSSGTASHEDMMELEKATRNTITISPEDTGEVKTLCAFLHVPCFQARGEADGLLANLYARGEIHGVVSEDTDMLTHGIGIVVRGLIDAANRSSGTANMYSLNVILRDFGMSMRQFLDFCILSGCDYCPRITGVGPVTSYKHIKSGGTPVSLGKEDTYEARYLQAVDMFSTHDDVGVEIKIEPPSPCQDGLIIWMLEKTNMTEKTLLQKLKNS